MTSSRADWVLGEARLISSAMTTLANTGPGRNSNSRVPWLKIVTPLMSEGRRSGVNWMRRQSPFALAAMARARVVLPVPGTSSSRMWPWVSIATSASRTTSDLPRTAASTEAAMPSNSSARMTASSEERGASEGGETWVFMERASFRVKC